MRWIKLNTRLLKAKMVEKGFTQSTLAIAIGISEMSLSRKINGLREFRLSEACKICEVLDIENPAQIFFAKTVPNTQQ
nr:MAG: BetR domain protein [Bacteriophage sp.]